MLYFFPHRRNAGSYTSEKFFRKKDFPSDHLRVSTSSKHYIFWIKPLNSSQAAISIGPKDLLKERKHKLSLISDDLFILIYINEKDAKIW